MNLTLVVYKTRCPGDGCRSVIQYSNGKIPFQKGWRRRRGRGLICPACLVAEAQAAKDRAAAERAARPRGRQGFASMAPERRRAVAAKGGKSAHAQGLAHRWSPEEARRAGQKQGKTAKAIAAAFEKAGRSLVKEKP